MIFIFSIDRYRINHYLVAGFERCTSLDSIINYPIFLFAVEYHLKID